MTTVTPLASSTTTASITLNPAHCLSKINRNIYSGFAEHMGRCIYGGIYDPDNPNQDLITPEGFRKDVLDALQPLNIPIVRYPGGNFCATYHWEDGIGPRNRRPSRPELAWQGLETNQFGTDEFMVWCKQLGTEPYLCLNFGTGTLDEALGWLEYCNSTTNTHYASLRRQNGHPDPYNVKYWALGNEMWGPWQLCQLTQEAYADKAFQWAKALKLLDPTIQLVLCGKEGATSWDHHVLKHCLRPAGQSDLGEFRPALIDMHSIHLYTASLKHYENVTAPLAAERSIQVASALIDLACIENQILLGQQTRPSICFDEWNVWLPSRATGSRGAEEKYTLSDALAVAVWLNVFVRQSRDVQMACLAQTVNVLSPLMTTPHKIIRQTTWWPYELFCRFVSGWLVQCHVVCGAYDGTTNPEWIRGLHTKTPWLDVSASVDEHGDWITLCVVNMHQDENIETEIQGVPAETKVMVYTVTGKDVRVTNMAGEEEVSVQETQWMAEDRYKFPKHSFTMMRWKG